MAGYGEADEQELARMNRRALLVGGPQMGKTTSIVETWPKPMAIFSYPGELGFGSIPKSPEIKAFRWGDIDLSKPVDWTGIVRETKLKMAEVITGKHGPFKTLAGDGLHKLHFCYVNHVSQGAVARGESIDARKVYPPANAMFFQDLKNWIQSSIEYMVFTVWMAPDKEDPNKPDSPSRAFPALPGQAGQNVCGEFTVVVAAERQGTGPAAKYVWRTKPDERIHGVGIKAPLAITSKIPQLIPQDWPTLEKYLLRA
jgi:hypothetical protein